MNQNFQVEISMTAHKKEALVGCSLMHKFDVADAENIYHKRALA
jgi:hypothetical protein